MENEKSYMLWLRDKHKYFEEFLTANKDLCLKCREHCDNARKICEPKIHNIALDAARLKQAVEMLTEENREIFSRLRTAELKLAGMAKGALIIGGCAILAAIIGHFLRYF